MQPLEVVVRGRARRRYPPERATVRLSARIEGTDREGVYRQAVGVSEAVGADLTRLVESGAATQWTSEQLRVFSYRPHSDEGIRAARYQVNVGVEAEFTDFEVLSSFLDRWAIEDGVEVGHTSWDLLEDNRQEYEALLRRDAVVDATAKAQAFATAAGRGAVEAVQLADPGMLGQQQAPQAATFAAPAGVSRQAASLDLRPKDIVLDVLVDARFAAE